MELSFVQAFSLTFIIETAVLYLLLRDSQKTEKIIFVSLVANALTHPIVWFVFPQLALLFGFGYPLQTALSELFAFFVETVVFVLLFPKMALRKAAFISFACNVISFIIGLLLTYVF